MASNERELVRVLEAEVSLYQQLLALKETEREALLDLNDQSLKSVVISEEELIEQAGQLEQKRRDVIKELLPDQEVSVGLRELLPHLRPGPAARCQELGQQLLATCDELGRKQFENAQIMKRSMEFMQQFLSGLVERACGQTSTYVAAPGHRKNSETLPGVLDQKV